MMHPMGCDDAALVAAARRGDRAAFADLLDRHVEGARALCRRILGDGADAQDAVQEATLQAYLGLPRLRAPERFGAWFHAIAANLARRALRRRALSLDVLADRDGPAALLRDGAPLPDEVQLAREAHDAVVAALGLLPAAHRRAVLGFYVEGAGYGELAALLGVPVSTVRGRLYQGRLRLRRALAAFAPGAAHDTSEKERPMTTHESVPVEVLFVGRYGHSDKRLVMLGEVGGPRRLPVTVDAPEGEAIERSLAGAQPPQPLAHDLALALVRSLGGRVRGAELRRLAGDAVVATVAVARGRAEHRLEARAGDALSLALRAGAPVRAATGLLAAAGFDPTDEAQMRERDARHVRALTERIAARTEAPPRPPFPPPAPLDTARQRRVEAALERLRGELAGRSAVLLHRSGALVAWRGAFDADPALLRDYALALASADADLVDLLMCRLFARRSGAGVVFADFGDGWRLEVALTEERADGHERLMGTAAELEPLLAGRAVG